MPNHPLAPGSFDIVPHLLDHAATTQSGPLGALEINSEPHGRSTSVSGTITLMYVSDHELIGTATAVMDNGDDVTVTFTAPSCDTLKW